MTGKEVDVKLEGIEFSFGWTDKERLERHGKLFKIL
jgi:hypothetical protein